jgi:lauroyl/myristoyl acyltransferase
MRIFEMPLYALARAIVALLQSLPLRWLARLGRFGGALAWWLDRRHRRVTLHNLNLCFGNEKSVREIHNLARENFKCIGENYACAVKTAAMSFEELRPHVEFIDGKGLGDVFLKRKPRNIVIAVGHFGNFELYARLSQFMPGYQSATTYRGIRPASLNRLLQSLRERSGCRFFERRFDAGPLKTAMSRGGIVLGLLSDQRGGDGGLRLPFLGHDCSTSAAAAIFALRYDAALFTGFCFRTGLAKWRIESGDEIRTHQDGRARSSEAIMRDINRAFEVAVRRYPANWFWVHNRWKMPKKLAAATKIPSPEAVERTQVS